MGLLNFFKKRVINEKPIDPDTLLELGLSYTNDSTRDYQKALQYIQQAFLIDKVKSAFPLGYLYYKGFGIKKDESKAFELINLAANNPKDKYCKRAQLYLGHCYCYAHGVSKDENVAFMWYKKSTEDSRPSPDALLELGDCYSDGIGTEKDDTQALKCYQEIWHIEKGKSKIAGEAAGKIGYIFQMSDQVMTNDIIAFEWYNKGASVKDPMSLHFMGVYYSEGLGGVAVDKTKAYRYLYQAAQSNYIGSLTYLFYTRCMGIGTEQEVNEIRSKCFELAEKGQSRIQYEIGTDYLFGTGINPDTELAKKYITLAAKNGNVDAIKFMIDACRYGSYGLFPINDEKAKEYEAFQEGRREFMGECKQCNGYGRIGTCPTCNGTGRRPGSVGDQKTLTSGCPDCNSTGKKICDKCNGTGYD